jgi:two-component system, NarL family, response regulator NreC
MSLRILIADDHGVMRAGLRALLNAEADLEVVGEAATSDEALRLVSHLCPDIVLMDISMPGSAGNGIEVTRRVRETAPGTRILILTMHEDKGLLREAIKAGASGYILKRAAAAELKGAIDAVAGGDLYIHPSMVRALIADAAPAPFVHKVDAEGLSPREMEVLRLIVQGYTNHQMADELSISVRTVESHRANLMSKLNVRSRVELVRYARSRGLMEPA